MVKIDSLELENVKRVKAVSLRPSPDGLTVIGGRNGQGKTSVLDSIAWALGGNRYRPSSPRRDGAAGDPRLKVTLDNGVVVERKGAGGSLKVTDPAGRKAGQALLDSFLGQFALDLPRFMAMSEAEKTRALMEVAGIGGELAELEERERTLYAQRTGIGQMRDQKRGAAADMDFHPDAPEEPVSAAELVREQQDILARNGENARKRERAAQIARDLDEADARAARLRADLKAAEDERARLAADLETAAKTAEQLRDESTAEIEARLAEIDAINQKVRVNAARRAAEAEAEELDAQYKDMTEAIEWVRRSKRALLEGCDLPMPGLSVEGGRLVLDGKAWDCMSGSDQLKAATAIARRTNPECGFVLVDKLEQMDPQTLAEFGEWAEAEGLQVIGTRVSSGDDGTCSIVIEDGYGEGADPEPHAAPQAEAAAGKWVM